MDCQTVQFCPAVPFVHPPPPVHNAQPVHPVKVIVHIEPVCHSINTHPPVPHPPPQPQGPATSDHPAHQFHHIASIVPVQAIVGAYIKIIHPEDQLPPQPQSQLLVHPPLHAPASHQYTKEFKYHLDGDIRNVNNLLNFKKG